MSNNNGAANLSPGLRGMIDGNINVASNVNDHMSFNQAFAAARSNVGPGGVFEWHGKLYGTYTSQEWNHLSSDERSAFNNHFSWSHHHADETPAETASVDASASHNVYMATHVNDHMSFNEAFSAARNQVGPGGVFEWHGKTYNTYTAAEWNNMSAAEKNAFAVQSAHAQDYTPPVSPARGAAEDNHVATVEETSEQEISVEVDDDAYDSPVKVITNDSIVEPVAIIDGDGDLTMGAALVDGRPTLFVDLDNDGLFDMAMTDLNGDGQMESTEMQFVGDHGFSVDSFGLEDCTDTYDAMDSDIEVM